MTRALAPKVQSTITRDGVTVGYEVFGAGADTIVMLPPWSLTHSHLWKLQVPYLARHARVVTIDPRGNGRSSRPTEPAAHHPDELVRDALDVMDAVGVARALVVAHCAGSFAALSLAADHPERVQAVAFIAPSLPLSSPNPKRAAVDFDARYDSYEGWRVYNRHFWRERWPEFVAQFVRLCFPEPHSSKPIEDCVGWGLSTTPEVMLAAHDGGSRTPDEVRALLAKVRCPVLALHGDRDLIIPHARGAAVAEATGGRFVLLEGSGHAPMARDPVRVNLLLRDFLVPPAPPRTWRRAAARSKRALFVSSPIGLGHAQRDLAIADELRRVHPGLEIDWLAQPPLTTVLEARGERIHPASRHLAGESAHLESEAGEHDLHVFQAWRRMDEILVANFMVFHDVVRDTPYDLWVGDEAWEIDYFLHENPEEKRAPYVWLTDFVGWLPMPDGGPAEAALAADYNLEMIRQIERAPRVRDRALFVGDPEDVVPHRFGAELPEIRAWTEAHYRFTGYVTGFDPAPLHDRAALRRELGYRADEQVCVVAVGGSGVGRPLLERVVAAFAAAKRRLPALRMIVVAGPRIDPASIRGAGQPGLEVRPYVDRLYRHLAACDIAVVQGGLTTTMELAAAGRPFLYFPLRNHFEQCVHVPHRLARYGAGRRMDWDAATPDHIAAALVEELARGAEVRPVDASGAARAARDIAALL